MPRYQGLPPLDHITLTGPESYRFVRQSSDEFLRKYLRDGMCSGGSLNGVLGFSENWTVQALGLPHFFANHSRTLSDFERLKAPLLVPDFVESDKEAVTLASLMDVYPSSTLQEGSIFESSEGSSAIPEVVEVKNNCPFRFKEQRETFFVNDRGPADSICNQGHVSVQDGK
ncbi:hypothetical protein WJX73_004203 [Symbiochloris irregularis]|uniref:Uncharacterized protein n=1 Tax=Symbiochloris irregularis TaxID=706552 RepID=A0AAW1P1J3_9CHLO